MKSGSLFVPNADVDATDSDVIKLFERTLARIPSEVPPILTLQRVSLRRKGARPGLVGLTRWAQVDYRRDSHAASDEAEKGSQTMTFYTGLLDRLSSRAAVGVMVHELAHAWLNEHDFPTSSKAREREADELARTWGFGRELGSLEQETESPGR
jgi:hypothetical protein